MALSGYSGTIIICVIIFSVVLTNGLKCYLCGEYNEGVGSITPCFNYSEKYANTFLKECSKSSDKYCVKYVTELSTVRDCAAECSEKEEWDTQTYCCKEDSCNKAIHIEVSNTIKVFLFCTFGILYITRH